MVKLGDNERLCALESYLRLEGVPPQAGLEPTTARSAGLRLTYGATGAPNIIKLNTIIGNAVSGMEIKFSHAHMRGIEYGCRKQI